MPPEIAQLSLKVERALASLSDGEIAWTVTQATYRERFSPMAVAEVCCLYWLFLLRGYITSRLVRSARATPWMTPYVLDPSLRVRGAPGAAMPVTHDVLKIAIAQAAKQTAARDFGA